MKRAIVKYLSIRWRADTGGNIAIIFALSLIPILAIVGVAVDTQMTLTQKNKVQAVVDSAVIFRRAQAAPQLPRMWMPM